MFRFTKNEAQFVCWGALTAVYFSVFMMLATVSRELLLTPVLGIGIATPLSAITSVVLSYTIIWFFICHTNIPRRGWAKWFVGVQMATIFIIIETVMSKGTFSADFGLFRSAFDMLSHNHVITLMLISIMVAPWLLSTQRQRGFNI